MKTCKKKPDQIRCRMCLDVQKSYEQFESCSECELSQKRYEIIDIQTNFWGTYALLLSEGKIIKIPVTDVYDVKDS